MPLVVQPPLQLPLPYPRWTTFVRTRWSMRRLSGIRMPGWMPGRAAREKRRGRKQQRRGRPEYKLLSTCTHSEKNAIGGCHSIFHVKVGTAAISSLFYVPAVQSAPTVNSLDFVRWHHRHSMAALARPLRNASDLAPSSTTSTFTIPLALKASCSLSWC